MPPARLMPEGPQAGTGKAFAVPKGEGVKLGDLDIVNYHLSRVTADVEILKQIHRLLFGTQGAVASRKKNIRAFCGYDAAGFDAEKIVERITSSKVWTIALLKDALAFMGLDKSGASLELASRLVAFLAKPHSNVKAAPAKAAAAAGSSSPVKKTKGTKRASSRSEGADAGKTKAKKAKKAKPEGYPKAALGPYMLFTQSVRPEVKAANPDAKIPELGKILGAMWKEADQAEWKAKAAADKERFASELAAWKEANPGVEV